MPGGVASYPSSVLMNAVPAKVAGCARVAMVAPAPEGRLNPLVLAAARIAGVDEIYRVGGAQAIAALAYGTATIAPVAKIVGPGNAYVAAAKRRVFGVVGIDMIAGPSEVVVLADATADPAFVAADLLAAGRARRGRAIDPDHRRCAARPARRRGGRRSSFAVLPREKIAAASWRDYGAIIKVGRLADAVALVDRLAPEHLEIIADRRRGAVGRDPQRRRDLPRAAIRRRRSATMSAAPTMCCRPRARRGSPPGSACYDFVKRTSILACDAAALKALGPAAVTLGKAEGLDAHARSVAMRLERLT